MHTTVNGQGSPCIATEEVVPRRHQFVPSLGRLGVYGLIKVVMHCPPQCPGTAFRLASGEDLHCVRATLEGADAPLDDTILPFVARFLLKLCAS